LVGRSIDRTPPSERALVVLPVLPEDRHASNRLAETEGLVEALNVELSESLELSVRKPNPATLLGGGQLERLERLRDAYDPTLLIVDSSLTPVQQRNLERALQLKVIDRTGLILEIFGLRARTAEGRLQVELARQLYERSRLVRTWTHLERQRGGHGFLSGPGETQIEADRRMLDSRIRKLRRDIEDVRRSRRIQRAGRLKLRKPVVALVGYTNAGKSTIFNALTNSSVLAKDMPFATLDPTVREFQLGDGRRCVMVDTVGFITDLPSHLVAAFRATLEEVAQAAALIHVRDISHPDTAEQAHQVELVLEQIFSDTDEPRPPTLEVWNKSDLLTAEQKQDAQARSREQFVRAILASGTTGEGLHEVLADLSSMVFPERTARQLKLPPDTGGLRAWLHAHCDVRSEVALDDGTLALEVAMSDEELAQFQALSPTLKNNQKL